MRKVAITGATGFIGSILANRLQATGWQARALARSDRGASALRLANAEVVRGSLADHDALAALTRDADAVVHCAGAVRGVRYSDFEAVNVAGTQALLRSVQRRDIPIVLLSSLAAREPQLSHYARSKRTMETLLEGADDPPNPWLVLRPPPVYGPGDRELLPLFQSMARGFAPLPGDVRARVSMLYVEDLAGAVVAWLAAPDAARGTFELHDGQPNGYSWDDVVTIAEELLGRRVRRLRLPK
ncbi:MAG: NAD-dependent epimerase/dehydratase family protein, partial [Salinisphaera sp.]|nr:NAD-dependent epimerase/dehydratase family protein [Salinisphaera sp.]